MSEQSPNGSSAEPLFATAPEFNFDVLVGGVAPDTDDAPTIISKTPRSHPLLPIAGTEGTRHGSIRGRTLAHFELLEPIGVGGMAAVLRARDKQLDRVVALKILPPEMAADPEHVKRFHQEARAAAKLDHENIARVFYCGEDQKLHFIAFEFVEGHNLRTILDQRGPLPVKEAVNYVLQIATGLAHAAARGVVHRDIKPSNIIITPSGRAKLVDMGLARNLSGANDKRQLTQSGVTLGTFDYISPEQALEPRDADVRSDIYSLGCTFYHMLTGQPPVPEGTAAKKLHHHQRVNPIDPRQLNPEIPVEVAAILHRMMAKDAKERYQGAEQLVLHLLQVAHKLGGADVPEGVMFVDAPLPNPPGKHPLLLAGIGALILTAFVVAVAVTAPPTPTQPLPRLKNPNKDELPPKKAVKDAVLGTETRKVGDAKQLADALADERVGTIALQGEVHSNSTGLTYRGKRNLVIESEDAKKPATLHFTCADNKAPFWAGLTVESGTVEIRHVQIVIKAAFTPRQLAAAVLVKGGQLKCYDSTFSQQTFVGELISQRDTVPVASVAAWNLTLDRPPLVLQQCHFANGQAAVSIKGSARVEVTDCAFGQHGCLFHVWGQDKDDAELILRQVSAHVVHGPAFRLDDNVNCTLNVQYSIFACPTSTPVLDRPDLLRQTGSARGTVVYKGKRNAYYQLPSYWTRPGKDEQLDTTDWAAFQKRPATLGQETNSSQLSASPWSKANASAEEDPRAAFQINPKLPDLRQEDKKRPLGVNVCAWGELYPPPGLAPLEQTTEPAVKLGPKERLVDPSGTAVGLRVHKKLEAAISEAEPDDLILIKYNGELKVEPTALTENRRIRLRPYKDYRPILILGKTTEKTTALFQLHHSHIELEQLEIVLRADANHRALSVVSIAGDSTCSFEKCVVTLDNTEHPGVEVEVVTLLDPREMLKLDAPLLTRAEIRFHACFVRGRGDLTAVRASRPFDLDVDSSLVCLAGSLLTVHPLGSDAMSQDSQVQVRLSKSTMYLADPALHLASAKMGLGLLLTHVNANGCLFGGSAAKPLVRVEGAENESQLKKVLGWSGCDNAFAGFDKFLEQTGSDGGAGGAYKTADWKRFTEAGADTRFDRTAIQPVVEREFTRFLPSDFAGQAEWANYGVQVEWLPGPAAVANRP